MRHLGHIFLVLCLVCPIRPRAETPPSPFGGTAAPTDRKDFEEENDVLSDPVDSFGFEPPENLAPPPLPNGGNFGGQPSNNGAAKTPEPRRALRPGGPPGTPTPRGTPPSALGGAKGQMASPGAAAKPAPKLEDYLELDSSVKGLQVQNFDLPDKDIKDVVTLISKWTGKNFILDSKVRGKITILGPSQVTLQEAYQAFLSALEANGLTTVKSGKFIRVIESAEARRAPVETYTGDYAPNTDQFITRIFQLQYISADEVQREFRDLVTRQGKLFAYAPTNSIIITDTGSNIRRIEDILRTLDVKGFETSLHVLRIRYSSAKQIADMLDQIYGEGRGGSSNAARTFRRSALERTRGGGIISKVIPDEQTNSLIVLANSAGFHSLIKLVGKLDVKVTDTGRIHVYYCEYAKAEDLANTLASLSGGGSSKGSSKSSSRNTRVTTNAGGPAANLTNPGIPGVGGGQTAGPVTAELGEGIKITADPATNALVITASSPDYQTLKRVIRKLDIPRLQVFVETAILEITLENKKNISVNLATAAQGLPFTGGTISDAGSLQSLVTGTIPEGATIPILAGNRVQANIGGSTINLRSFMGVLQFLQKTTNTSVLSTPQILALDNEKSEFKVQDEIPVQTGIPGTPASGTSATSVASIERLKTGIEIKLTPHVNAASRTVRLEIEQKVDSIAANTNVPSALAQIQKAKTTRETNTNVVVRDGDLIMLGGLMSDKVDESITKVPLLGDIPILGWLFKRTDNNVVKTNLIILLQPRIIGTSLNGAELLSEKFRKRREFLDRNNGGEDEHAEGVREYNKRIESQRRRGRGGAQPIYRNDEDEAKEPAAQRENPVNEDFADPDGEPKRVSDGAKRDEKADKKANKNAIKPDPNMGQKPNAEAPGRIPEDIATAPQDDALLVPPDVDGGGMGGGGADIFKGQPQPPPPDDGGGF